MLDGVLNIYKEKGYTSHDVVAKMRGILRQKKIGHTGTLDPDAEGVLPVCLGQGTRLCDMLTDHSKVYRAVLLLGIDTDTQDISGQILEKRPVEENPEKVLEVIKGFIGPYDQIPPMYSALKVNGKKLYELAREGKTVERKTRPVCFYEIEILEMDLPMVRFSVTCSKGTYIRTLCHDIGQKLGCGACMEELTRTASGEYRWEDSITLDEVQKEMEEGILEKRILSISEVLKAYPEIRCNKFGDRLLLNGNALPDNMTETQHKKGWVRMCTSEGNFLGIYEWDNKKHRYQPQKMFL